MRYLNLLAFMLVATVGCYAYGQDGSTNNVSSEVVEDSSTGSLNFMDAGEVPTSIDQLKAMESHVADLAEKVFPATVNIQVGAAQGTGVVVSRDGYILTAAHVIGGPNRTAIITFPDGKQTQARTLGVNRALDSGMLKISKKGRWPYLDIGESSTLNKGQWVCAIGHPGGIDKARGLVVRVGRLIFDNDNILNTDCILVGGDSGGPLVDMDGYVIGIHSRIGSSLTDNIHVPIDAFSNEWDQLADGKRIGERARPYLGFDIKDDTNEIQKVTEGSPADKAGLKSGDLIIKIDDKEIKDKGDIYLKARTMKPADEVKMTVKRGDEEIEIELVVGER